MPDEENKDRRESQSVGTGSAYYRNNSAYFEFQKNIGQFGGMANRFKFEQYIELDDTVIDFGCGGGYLLKNLNCRRKIGIECNSCAADEARKHQIEIHANAEPLEDGIADVIISNHALEHVENPVDQLRLLKLKLKDGGQIVFVVPHQDITEGYNPDDINNHIYTWNRQTIGNLFKLAGFDNIRIDLIQHQWPPDYLDIYRDKGEDKFHDLSRAYARKNNNFQLRISARKMRRSGEKNIKNASLTESQTPVVVVTYNRPAHTRKVLEALRRHGRHNLYLFSDGPKSDKDRQQVEETRQLFKTIDWTTPVIVERSENMGLAQSIVSAVNMVMESFDRVILLEDDCVPQEHFFDFMETCLARYAADKKIFGVSGYTVQVPENVRKDYPYDLYFTNRIGSWGWGTWKSAWKHFEFDLNAAYAKAIERGIDLEQGGNDIPLMLDQMARGQLKDVWTLNWVLTVYLNNGCFIYPTTSHLENIGMDGSGLHCGATDKFNTAVARRPASRYPQNVIMNPAMIANFRRFYDIAQPAIVPQPAAAVAPFKVVHINTFDSGGAANAAYRLHKGLRSKGIDSTMLVLGKTTDDPSIKVLARSNDGRMVPAADVSDVRLIQQLDARWSKIVAHHPFRPEGLEMFSDADSDLTLSTVREIVEADIIHLHWVSGVLNYDDLPRTIAGKAVVWTLHDMNPFTGGCHYAGDCVKYEHRCGQCEQLGSDREHDAACRAWQKKAGGAHPMDMTVVSPSRWLGECARRSSIMKRYPVEVIPNGLPTDIFIPRDTDAIRSKLGLEPSTQIVLFGAETAGNRRKGLAYLLEAFSRLDRERFSEDNLCLLVFGDLTTTVKGNFPYKILSVGRIKDESLLSAIYSVADVFVIPSLEDNLPNTVLESFACGTPVVGFDTGGISDLIDHRSDGVLAPAGDTDALARGIEWVLTEAEKGVPFSQRCRSKAEKHFAQSVQVDAYARLYAELMGQRENLNCGRQGLTIGRQAGPTNGKRDSRVSATPQPALHLYQEALARGIAVLDKQPNHIPTLLEMGDLMLKLERWDTALIQYRWAIDAASDESTVAADILAAASHLKRHGRSDCARDLYLSFLNKFPEHEKAIMSWGRLCDSEGAKSITEIKRAQPSDYRVSAIVSTYRSEAFIGECLENLLAQSIAGEIEIVIVDAASPEDERSFVLNFRQRHPNITYIRTRDRIGIYSAWNIAIAHARGNYCISVSTNDQLRPNACQLLADLLDWRPETVLVYGDTCLTRNPHETFDRNSHYDAYRWPDYSFAQHLEDGCCIGPHPMWRRSVHANAGYFDERFVAVGDQDFWLRLGAHFPILHTPEFTGLQWITGNALSGKGDTPALEVAFIQQLHRLKTFDNHLPATPTDHMSAAAASLVNVSPAVNF